MLTTHHSFARVGATRITTTESDACTGKALNSHNRNETLVAATHTFSPCAGASVQMRAHAASHVLTQLSRKCLCRGRTVANKNCQTWHTQGNKATGTAISSLLPVHRDRTVLSSSLGRGGMVATYIDPTAQSPALWPTKLKTERQGEHVWQTARTRAPHNMRLAFIWLSCTCSTLVSGDKASATRCSLLC